MGKLSDLATKYKTDKCPADHAYTPIYEKWLDKRQIESLLEVGFGSGASARMWTECYPLANIYCVEYKNDEHENVWKSPDLNINGLKTFIGDSTKKETWDNIPREIDVIIDDGSHFPKDQIETFLIGFEHLKSGGLYFIEDTHCGGEQKYGATTMLYEWLRDLCVNQQAFHVQTGGDFYKARPYMGYMTRDIFSIHSYKSLIVIEKA